MNDQTDNDIFSRWTTLALLGALLAAIACIVAIQGCGLTEAPASVQTTCRCAETGVCTCAPGECDCPECPVHAVKNDAAPTQNVESRFGVHVHDTGRNPRLLLATTDPVKPSFPCLACRVVDGVNERLESSGWKVGTTPDCHIQILPDDRDVWEQYGVETVPTFIRWENGRETARYSGTDMRRIVELAYGDVQVNWPQPEPQVGYPVRGGWWSFPGSSRADLIAHLMSGEHAGKFNPSWLNALSWEQLNSLHSDDHEGRARQPRIQQQPYGVNLFYRVPYQHAFYCPAGG